MSDVRKNKGWKAGRLEGRKARRPEGWKVGKVWRMNFEFRTFFLTPGA